MSRYHTLVRHHSQFARKREQLDWLREHNANPLKASIVRTASKAAILLGYGILGAIWAVFWVGLWVVLP